MYERREGWARLKAGWIRLEKGIRMVSWRDYFSGLKKNTLLATHNDLPIHRAPGSPVIRRDYWGHAYLQEIRGDWMRVRLDPKETVALAACDGKTVRPPKKQAWVRFLEHERPLLYAVDFKCC